MPAATRTSRQLLLADTTRRRRPRSSRHLDEPYGSVVHLDAVTLEQLDDEAVLAGTEPVDSRCDRRVVHRTFRDGDRARCKEGPHAVSAQLAVDVPEVVRRELEEAEGLAQAGRALAEEGVEHLLPGCRVDPRRLGQDAVEIE